MTIRLATPDDLAAMRSVERAAGEPFRAIGMAAVADEAPPSTVVLRGVVDGGRAWIAERDGRAVGHLLAEVVDGEGHVAQVSVHPDAARRRLGQALVERAAEWARATGLPALTLTAFADVPWNAPYYARLGFRVLGDDELGPGLRAIRRREIARGLDRWPRVAMRRELPLA